MRFIQINTVVHEATVRIIGLTKVVKIEFLSLDWIYRSIRIMTVHQKTAVLIPLLQATRTAHCRRISFLSVMLSKESHCKQGFLNFESLRSFFLLKSVASFRKPIWYAPIPVFCVALLTLSSDDHIRLTLSIQAVYQTAEDEYGTCQLPTDM